MLLSIHHLGGALLLSKCLFCLLDQETPRYELFAYRCRIIKFKFVHDVPEESEGVKAHSKGWKQEAKDEAE